MEDASDARVPDGMGLVSQLSQTAVMWWFICGCATVTIVCLCRPGGYHPAAPGVPAMVASCRAWCASQLVHATVMPTARGLVARDVDWLDDPGDSGGRRVSSSTTTLTRSDTSVG